MFISMYYVCVTVALIKLNNFKLQYYYYWL